VRDRTDLPEHPNHRLARGWALLVPVKRTATRRAGKDPRDGRARVRLIGEDHRGADDVGDSARELRVGLIEDRQHDVRLPSRGSGGPGPAAGLVAAVEDLGDRVDALGPGGGIPSGRPQIDVTEPS